MPEIGITVSDRVARPDVRDVWAVCGNSDYTITWTLDAEWSAAHIRTAVFVWRDRYTNHNVPVIFEGTSCPMPAIPDALVCAVGLWASVGEGEDHILRTTSPAMITMRRSSTADTDRPIITQDVYDELLAAVNAALDASVEEAAAHAAAAANSAAAAAGSATAAAESATSASASATAAGSSATSAAGSASSAHTDAAAALEAKNTAVSAKDTAVASKTAAEAAETAAETAASAAATSAEGAALSEDAAAASATAAAGSAEDAQEVLDSIPEDYSTLSSDVTDLKSAIDATAYDKSLWKIKGMGTINSGAEADSTIRLLSTLIGNNRYSSVESVNGYEMAFYAWTKSGSYAGLVKPNGAIEKSYTNFQWATSFDFTKFPNHLFKIMVRNSNSPDTDITIDEAENVKFTDNAVIKLNSTAIEQIPIQCNNMYIVTGVSDTTVPVDLTPVSYSGFGYAIVDCKAGDKFTVSGHGGGSGRLWAFVDSNKMLLSTSPSSWNINGEVITAPLNASKAIFNVNTSHAYNITSGDISIFESDSRAELIPLADIHDFPSAIVRPTIAHKSTVNEVSGISDVKGTIHRNGNDFCIIYNENLNGSTTDLPSVSGTGTLAMKYKYFHYENGVESNISYGEIAKKGTAYIKWDDTSSTFDGGCGVPSGTDGIQYFSSAYTGTKRYNNINNYGLRPCACTVSVSSSGVTFGDLRELSLTVNGVKGAFDIARIDPSYYNYYIYYTTTPPCKMTNTLWYWLQPVIRGIAVFTSEDGFDWTFIAVIPTWYQPQCEVCSVPMKGVNGNHTVLFAARTWVHDNHFMDTNTYIGRIRADVASLYYQYRVPCKSSRPYLINDNISALLIYNPTTWDEASVVRVYTSDDDYQMYFHRWFSLYRDGTWYDSVDKTTLTNNYTTMYLVGNNGAVGENRGLSFMELGMDATPKTIYQMSAGIE